MNTILVRLLLLLTIALPISGCVLPNPATVETHLQASQAALENRDFALALGEVEQAERLIADKSPSNSQYVSVLVQKANTYAYFERLDEAESVLLTAAGIPNDKITVLANSRQPVTSEQYMAIADDLQTLTAQDNQAGYHIALSLIYNILGDTQQLQTEQQRAMDVSLDRDKTLAIAMALYKVRGRKIEVLNSLEHQKELVKSDPTNLAYQLQLGFAYYSTGWFAEAESIADEYLSMVDQEKSEELYLGFLALKMNLAMGEGHPDLMKQYEEMILQIDPHAFDASN